MTDEQYAALAMEMNRISARLKKINDDLDEVEAKTSDNYEKLTSIGEGLETVEALLFDIGIDPDAEYSTLDRSILRDRLAGTRVAGVMVS